jgi:hypothetical protein
MSRNEADTGPDRVELRAVVAIFAVAFLVPAWPWLSGAVTIPWDAKAEFQPQLQFLATALAHGQSPFWTPNVFGGWPQVADPQSLIFSPLHVALALIDAYPGFRAADAVTFAALFLGGLGVILIFRDRGWHPAGAVVAALAFAFGGAAASRLQHTGEVMSLCYLPFALWLLGRALDRTSRQYGAAAGIACGLIALGRDQVALLGLYVVAGLVIAHWLAAQHPLQRVLASIRPLAAAAVVAGLVAGLPVLMTALLAAGSNRPEIDYVSAGRGSLHPGHLITLAFADLFGLSNPATEFWGPPSRAWGWTGLYLAQNMGQLYAGALPLIAVTIGVARGALWAREVRFFMVAALLALLYGLGWYTPAFRVLYEILPGVDLFRRPADAAFVIGGLFAIVGGYAIHRVLSSSDAGHHVAVAIATIVLLVAVAVALAALNGRLDVALRPIVVGTACLAGAAGALAVARRLRQPLAATMVLAAFAAIDLAWNNAPNQATGLPPSTYDVLRPDTRNDTIALLKTKLDGTSSSEDRYRIELSGLGYQWPNASLVHGFEGLFGLNPLRLKAYADATGVGDTVATPEQRTFSKLFPGYRSMMADLLGLRFIATGVPAEQIDTRLEPGDLTFIARTADAYVYENPRALPRVLLVTGWQLADFDAMMRTGEWPQFDPHRTVLLDRPPPIPLPAAGNAAASGVAVVARYRNTEVDIDVDAPAGGLLVLHDVWHPWWRASVDFTPAPILKANVLFRAIAVAPGRHQIAFRFEPLQGAIEDLRAKLR